MKCDPWTEEDLRQAVNDLERNKSRDALDHANELFKDDVAGSGTLIIAPIKS